VSVEGGGIGKTIGSLVVVGALFGLINTFIKPVVKFFSFPFYILTLGLFAFVVNAVMLEIVDWLSDRIGITFDTGPFFWSTLGAAIVITFVSMILNIFVPDGGDD
jgi:putative membrane protein